MNKNFLFGAMALGLLFTGCQSDNLTQEPDAPKTDADRTYYVSMNIRGDVVSGSRADGDPTFDAGTDESEVKNAYFVFYNSSGTMVGEIVKVDLESAEVVTNPADNTVDKYYQSVVPVSVNKGEDDPTQVVCYINPITPASLQNPLNVIQTNTRDILYTTGSSKKYFAMSNSVYYPEGKEDPQIAVPVDKKSLFNSEVEAKAALEALKNNSDAEKAALVVDIYVERYAAKLTFQHVDPDKYVTATSLINNDAEIPVTLTFTPNKWILNAACEETYIVKSFRQESTEGQILPDNYTNTALDGIINGTDGKWNWNAPTYHRSYWGMSPAYFTAEYPEVSSDVTGDLQGKLKQKYYSYNELIGTPADGENPAVPGIGFNANTTEASTKYFHETTVGSKALGSKNPAAAVPSVILVGDYTLKVNDAAVPAGTTFYTYLTGSAGKPLVYFEANNDAQGTSAVTGGESMLRRFIEQTSILFKADGVPYDITDETDMATLVAVLEVAEPSTSVKGNLKLPERYRTLQFKEGAVTTGIYVATEEGYMPIAATTTTSTISLTDANIALMQQVGFCNRYVAGAGYFNIPVKHLGWYRSGNTQKDAEKIDWNIVRVGDFGVVRNHSYSINVTAILGLATGIGGKDSPIVPPSDTKDYFVAYRVNILKWAVVPTQSVKL